MTDVSVAEAIAYLKELVRRGYDENHLMSHYSQAFRDEVADLYEQILTTQSSELAVGTLSLEATGDATTDTANLKNALEQLQYAHYATSSVHPVLLTSGLFKINQPLQVGGSNLKTPLIDGQHKTIFEWRGSKTSDYMFTFGDPAGPGQIGKHPCLINSTLNCYNNSRGILVYYQTYRPVLKKVYVYQSWQVGVDLVSCWGSCFRDHHLRECLG